MMRRIKCLFAAAMISAFLGTPVAAYGESKQEPYQTRATANATIAPAPNATAFAADTSFEVHASDRYVLAIGKWSRPERSLRLKWAIRAFGSKGMRRQRQGGTGCRVVWRSIGVVATFANFGIDPRRKSPCHPKVGRVQWVELRDPRWSTAEGLSPGDPWSQVATLYPDADRNSDTPAGELYLRYAERDFCIDSGNTPCLDPTLIARRANDRVRALEAFILAAGD